MNIFILITFHALDDEWTWASDNSAASVTVTCSGCDYSKTADATVAYTKESGSTPDTEVEKRTATATIDGVDFTDVKTGEEISVGANDIYNLTLQDSIDVNMYIERSTVRRFFQSFL
ncbi:MAG: hypothetical protein K6C14_08865 [Eubacterium sp.]|nr:hypothetical protein [Eubacterium sp.]